MDILRFTNSRGNHHYPWFYSNLVSIGETSQATLDTANAAKDQVDEMKRQSETSVDVLPFFDVAGKMSDDKKNIFNISLKNLGKGPAFHIRGTISDTQTREDLTQSAKPFISVLSAEDENLMAYGIAA